MRVLRVQAGRAAVGEGAAAHEVLQGGRELAQPGGLLWLDLTPDAEDLAFLARRFGFHPLALEDCAHEDQRVKLELFGEHAFLVVQRIMPAPDDSELQARELHAFLTSEALVTVHSAPIGELDRVFERCAGEPGLLARGPDFALYLLLDAVTDVHFALVDALSSDVEELADEVLAHPGAAHDQELLERIVLGRRAHAVLRKRLSPQREVIAALARPGTGLVKEQTSIYFRDVSDHIVRLTEEVDMGRDLLASTMEAHLSHTNNRLSSVMARLTLISTIFLPLNFLVGFYGMNLSIVPERLAIPMVLGSLVILPAALYTFFRYKRWM